MAQATYVEKRQYKPTPEAKKWLKEQFEFENCDECHRGARGHTAVGLVTGQPFALCKPQAGHKLTAMQRKVFTKVK